MRPPLFAPQLLRCAAHCQHLKGLILRTQKHSRSFHLPSLSSLAPSFSTPPPRTLTATRTLPFPALPLFRTISGVDSYAQFLPFLTESTVTERDVHTGFPTQAYLTVGYGPFTETFLSKVQCDKEEWTVAAKSGEVVFKGNGSKDGAGNGLFEYLNTMWKLEELPKTTLEQGPKTRVELVVRFKFRSAMHAAMMSAVEGQVAGMMIEAFEKRVKDLEESR